MKVTIILLIASVAAMVGVIAGIIYTDNQELNDYGK